MSDIPWIHIATVATTIGGYLLAFVLIPRILLDRREAGATLAWILAIFFLPYLGAALFFLIGRTRVRRRTRKRRRFHEQFVQHMDRLPEPPCAYPSEGPDEAVAAAKDVTELASAVTGSEPLPGNQVEIFTDANVAYRRMEQAILAAEEHVHLQSYIYRADEAGERFRDLLARKAAQGVECRLLVDGVGGNGLRKAFIKPLLQAGGRFARFMPVFRFRPHWRPNLRNHRKILVVDGRKGFCGGLNIGEEYQGRKKRYAPWRDTHLEVDGPSVRRLQEVFAEDWLLAAGEDLAAPRYFPDTRACGPELIQVVDSGPDCEHETIYAVFFTAVTEANERIYITTPYFVPDRPMLMALKAAAWRGVDVRLLLPGRSDLKLVQLAGRSYYQELLDAGVRIYEHRPGILHAKTMVVDGIWSTVGSANMDIRSFRLNFEANILVSGQRFALKMEALFRQDIGTAAEVTREGLEKKPRSSRMVEAVARVFSPVL